DHGQLVFVDLRDHYGITQCVADSASGLFEGLSKLKNESVVTITGAVVKRAVEVVNANLPTGEIELAARALHIESVAEP
ncbi:OB-fold nucleic acid binding domain-containing protein, partial [Vibrio parahaemolyticus]